MFQFVLFFLKYVFSGLFMPLMYRTVEIDRKQEVERGGMTSRSTHGAGALLAELCSTPVFQFVNLNRFCS